MLATKNVRAWGFQVISAASLAAMILSGCGGGGGGGSGGTSTAPTAKYSIGGSVTGLTAAGLVLQDNGGDNLTVPANATSYTFPTQIASGGAYSVTVLTQPAGQTCSVAAASGTASASVTTAAVTCTTSTYHVTGTISGLTSAGLVLQDNGGDNLTVAANASTFTFATPLSGGTAYSVTVLTQPAGPALTCTVANGSGTIGAADVTNVQISCVAATFTVGGTITGLTSAGLVLTNNGADSLTVAPNASTFSFATNELQNAAYAVAITTQPGLPRQYCSIANGSGTVGTANVSNVAISCHAFGRFVYVANATDGPGSNGDVSAFTINPADGTLTPVAAAAYAADVKPSGIVVDPTGQFVYVSNRTSADVSVYAVNQTTGALTLTANPKSKNTFGTSIAISPSGKYVVVGGSGPNSTSSLFVFTADPTTGALTADSNSPYVASNQPYGLAIDPSSSFLFAGANQLHSLHSYELGGSPLLVETANSPVSTGSQPYGVAVKPNSDASGGYVYVADYGLNRISGYAYDSTGTLTELTSKGSPWPTGLGPQGLTLDPTGAFMYVANYLDGTVSSFSVATNGQLTGIQTNNSAPNTGNLGGIANPGPSDVKVDPAAPYLYVANQLDGSVSLFSIMNGTITLVSTYPAGDGAISLAID